MGCGLDFAVYGDDCLPPSVYGRRWRTRRVGTRQRRRHTRRFPVSPPLRHAVRPFRRFAYPIVLLGGPGQARARRSGGGGSFFFFPDDRPCHGDCVGGRSRYCRLPTSTDTRRRRRTHAATSWIASSTRTPHTPLPPPTRKSALSHTVSAWDDLHFFPSCGRRKGKTCAFPSSGERDEGVRSRPKGVAATSCHPVQRRRRRRRCWWGGKAMGGRPRWKRQQHRNRIGTASTPVTPMVLAPRPWWAVASPSHPTEDTCGLAASSSFLFRSPFCGGPSVWCRLRLLVGNRPHAVKRRSRPASTPHYPLARRAVRRAALLPSTIVGHP